MGTTDSGIQANTALIETMRRTNPKRQGLIGLGDAIAWFTAHGYDVALPLNDSQKYDLVVEDTAGHLLRVEVKTTTCRTKTGRFVADIATNGGNRSRRTIAPFDPLQCELLYILTDARERYLIPTAELKPRGKVTLGERYARYLIQGL